MFDKDAKFYFKEPLSRTLQTPDVAYHTFMEWIASESTALLLLFSMQQVSYQMYLSFEISAFWQAYVAGICDSIGLSKPVPESRPVEVLRGYSSRIA